MIVERRSKKSQRSQPVTNLGGSARNAKPLKANGMKSQPTRTGKLSPGLEFPLCSLKDSECATCYAFGPVIDAPDIGMVCKVCWDGLRSQFEEDLD